MCAKGTKCAGGNCVDACKGYTCPSGQMCSDGNCVKVMTAASSSSTGVFAGTSTTVGAGGAGGAMGAGGAGGAGVAQGAGGVSVTGTGGFGGGPKVTSSCSCTMAGGGNEKGGLAVAGLALALTVARRRRKLCAIVLAGGSAMTAGLAGCATGDISGVTGTGGSTDDAGAAETTTSTSGHGSSSSSSGTSSTGSVMDPGCEKKKCGANAACAEIGGVPTCLCENGYLMSDGMTCVDIDECTAGLAACDPAATCANTPGSYTCTCNPGFTGNGKTCTDVDECTNHTAMCPTGMVCVNLPGGYQCTCPTGFMSNGAACIDINECALGTATCGTNATCANTPGSYTCTCNTGYMGDGMTCTDIDECAMGTAMCSPNATCANTQGSYTCTCNSGYLGDGMGCTPLAMGLPGAVSINGADATTTSTAVTLYLQEPHNLITNPSAATGDLSGWTIGQSGGSGWVAGPGDPMIHLFGPLVFITSYSLDTRSQTLDLVALGYTAAQLDASPPITVREWYRGGGYNLSDSYYLKVELRDASNHVVASLNDGATTTTTTDTWATAGQTFTGYGAGVRYVYFEDGGHDAEGWAGNYGASMNGASVVLGANIQMRVSNDNATWSAWQPFAPTLSWILDSAKGTKTVYVQYQDAGGMWPAISSTITLQ